MKFRVVLIPVLLVVLLGFLTKSGVSLAVLTGPASLINGLEVEKMETYAETVGLVRHMEIDLLSPGRLLFSEGSVFKETDGVSIYARIGSSKSGYSEGIGVNSQFGTIYGFTQINKTSVVVADTENHCLRLFHRGAFKTYHIAGSCTKSGHRDGVDALFSAPTAVMKDVTSRNKIIVADSVNRAVKQVDLISRITTTLISKSSGLGEPYGLAFDFNRDNLLVTNDDKISQYNFVSQTLSVLTGGKSSGFSDGALSSAQFYYPAELFHISSSVTLVADAGNNRLRVVNSATGLVESICTGALANTEGLADQCQLRKPFAVLATADGNIYIGAHQRIFRAHFKLVDMQKPLPDMFEKEPDPAKNILSL